MLTTIVKIWCKQNDWTEPFFQEGKFYAFAPNSVIPQPIPEWWNETDAKEHLVDYFCYIVFPPLLLASFLFFCMFLYQWRGIWSIYISQADHQKFLACQYCPLAPGNLVEMKEPREGLAEVQSVTISEPRQLRLTKNMAELVPQEEVKGRVLFIFPHEEFK